MLLVNENLIKKWEKLKLEAYLPTPNDVWTIGWGHTEGVYKGMTITSADAERLFDEDTAWAIKAVNDLVKVPLTQHQFDALVSLVFNIGRTNFSKSTVLRKLNAKDYNGASEAFNMWTKQKQKDGSMKTLKGLILRRAEEASYFMDADEDVITSASVDDPLKNLATSKEMWGGIGATVTGLGSLLGVLATPAQTVLVTALCVALIAAGGFFIINRLNARRKGER